MADYQSAGVNQGTDLFAPGWPQPQPREKNRRQCLSNRQSYSPSNGKEPLLRNQAPITTGRWQHDLFAETHTSENSTPYFRREKGALSPRSTDSPLGSPIISVSSRPQKEDALQFLDVASKTQRQEHRGEQPELHLQSRIKTTAVATKTPSNPENERSEMPFSLSLPPRETETASSQEPEKRIFEPSSQPISPEPALKPTWFDFLTPTPTLTPTPKRLPLLKPTMPHTHTASTISPSSRLAPPKSRNRRPETTDIVARRMIANALGVRIPRRSDEKSVEIAKVMRLKRAGTGSGAGNEKMKSAKDEKIVTASKGGDKVLGLNDGML